MQDQPHWAQTWSWKTPKTSWQTPAQSVLPQALGMPMRWQWQCQQLLPTGPQDCPCCIQCTSEPAWLWFGNLLPDFKSYFFPTGVPYSRDTGNRNNLSSSLPNTRYADFYPRGYALFNFISFPSCSLVPDVYLSENEIKIIFPPFDRKKKMAFLDIWALSHLMLIMVLFVLCFHLK